RTWLEVRVRAIKTEICAQRYGRNGQITLHQFRTTQDCNGVIRVTSARPQHKRNVRFTSNASKHWHRSEPPLRASSGPQRQCSNSRLQLLLNYHDAAA